jgi:hypothetical protein
VVHSLFKMVLVPPCAMEWKYYSKMICVLEAMKPLPPLTQWMQVSVHVLFVYVFKTYVHGEKLKPTLSDNLSVCLSASHCDAGPLVQEGLTLLVNYPFDALDISIESHTTDVRKAYKKMALKYRKLLWFLFMDMNMFVTILLLTHSPNKCTHNLFLVVHSFLELPDEHLCTIQQQIRTRMRAALRFSWPSRVLTNA